jgi:hypothetical protein
MRGRFPVSGSALGGRNMRSHITNVAAVLVLAMSALGVSVGTARAAERAPAVQLTGSQLAADLLPAGTFPRGYRYDASTSHESGPRLETGRAKYHLASISCKTLGNAFDGPGFGETAMAADSFSTLVGNLNAKGGAVFAQAVYQFATSRAAQSFWLGVRSATVRCPGFGALGGAGTERIVKASIRGTQAFQADFSASLTPTASISVQSLFVLRGVDVLETDAAGVGRAVPASPSLRTLMTRLLPRIP